DLWVAIGAAAPLVVIRLQTVLWSSILQGSGRVAQYNRVEGNANVVITLAQALALLVAPSVLTLLAAQFAGCLVLLLWTISMSSRRLRESGVEVENVKPSVDMARQLWSPTWRLALTMLGAFLLGNGPSFFVGHLATAEIAAAYLLCMRLLSINRSVSSAFVI